MPDFIPACGDAFDRLLATLHARVTAPENPLKLTPEERSDFSAAFAAAWTA